MKKGKLFVGNLGNDIPEEELKNQFSYFGQVRFFRVIPEKGIAFVRMANDEEAYNARLGLNGVPFNGRRLRVMEAHP